jgi:hypothetical protein
VHFGAGKDARTPSRPYWRSLVIGHLVGLIGWLIGWLDWLVGWLVGYWLLVNIGYWLVGWLLLILAG